MAPKRYLLEEAQRHHSDHVAPLTEALIEEASISEGQTMLDVTGGAGEPSLTIAKKVGLTGSVICTDAAAEMVASAESEGHRQPGDEKMG